MSSWIQRLVKEAGREGNWAYDHTFGGLGGWVGKQFGNDDPQHSTALGNYTRHLFNMSAGGAIPFGGPVTGYAADYEGQRQLGNTRGRAAGIGATNFGISLASLLGGAAGGGFMHGGAAGSGVSGTGAGAGFSGVGSEGSLLGGTQMGAGGLYSGVGAGADSAALGGGGSVLGSGAAYTPLAGSQAGIMAGDTAGAAAGGMNYGDLIKKAMQSQQQGQQQHQIPPNDNALLAWLLSQQKQQQQGGGQPMWTNTGE